VLKHRDLKAPSLFTPENLLREARRQKSIPRRLIPRVCLLDPDGDMVRHLVEHGRAVRNPNWACYHTEMYTFRLAGVSVGIVGRAVGAPFAVLVAEEMFASGCRLLLSLTSAGRISKRTDLPRFLVISGALRDDGTSDHYLPRAISSSLSEKLRKALSSVLSKSPLPLGFGVSWTTDGPFRETAGGIRYARKRAENGSLDSLTLIEFLLRFLKGSGRTIE